MIEPDHGWDLVAARCEPLPAIRLPIERAAGYVLAEEIRADRDLPPADRSAMDGYAVRAEDLRSPPTTLRIAGEAPAGCSDPPDVVSGTCVRVFTGANVPPGADAVVMIEETRSVPGRTDLAEFPCPAETGAHILRRGEDARCGDTVARAGWVLSPSGIGVCAAVGRPEVYVHERPAVGILSTGAELLEPSAPVGPHQMRDSNGAMLEAALAGAGFAAAFRTTVLDEGPALFSAVREGLARSRCVVLTGGVSVGKYDLVPDAVRDAGGNVVFHGVRMKPGKPILFAVAEGERLVFGLPGNPLSALTGFHEFVLPALRRLAGMSLDACRPRLCVRLGEDLPCKGGRRRYAPAVLFWTETGPEAVPVPTHSSADLVAAAKADGALILPDEARVIPAGTVLPLRPWRCLP